MTDASGPISGLRIVEMAEIGPVPVPPPSPTAMADVLDGRSRQ